MTEAAESKAGRDSGLIRITVVDGNVLTKTTYIADTAQNTC